MKHEAIEQILRRVKMAKSDSDFNYFFSLLLAAEAIAKTIVLGMVAAIGDDKDRNRYRLEHQLMRADGLGDWSRVIDDALIGSASQFLLVEAREDQSELTRLCQKGQWQFDATESLKSALQILEIDSEEVPVKTDLKDGSASLLRLETRLERTVLRMLEPQQRWLRSSLEASS